MNLFSFFCDYCDFSVLFRPSHVVVLDSGGPRPRNPSVTSPELYLLQPGLSLYHIIIFNHKRTLAGEKSDGSDRNKILITFILMKFKFFWSIFSIFKFVSKVDGFDSAILFSSMGVCNISGQISLYNSSKFSIDNARNSISPLNSLFSFFAIKLSFQTFKIISKSGKRCSKFKYEN